VFFDSHSLIYKQLSYFEVEYKLKIYHIPASPGGLPGAVLYHSVTCVKSGHKAGKKYPLTQHHIVQWQGQLQQNCSTVGISNKKPCII